MVGANTRRLGLNELSDKELVVICGRGDKQAYTALVRRYSGRVFGICLGMVANTHDAEDLAQEALLKGFSQIGSLRDDEQFSPWLAVIAKRLCLDFLRRRKREQSILAQQDPPSAGPNKQDYHQLRHAVNQLSLTYRLPLLLYYFDGQSTKSLAETLKVSQTAVCNRLSRARRELRRILATQGGRL